MSFLKDNILSTRINWRSILKGVPKGFAALFAFGILSLAILTITIYWEVEFDWIGYGWTIPALSSFLIILFLGYPGVLKFKNISNNTIRARALVMLGLLGVLLLSLYFWREAYNTELLISYYDYFEGEEVLVRDAYNLAVKQILLVNGFFFASVLLLFRIFKKN